MAAPPPIKGRFKKGDRRIPGSGRRPGQPNRATIEVREAARNLIEDPKYVERLKRRLLEGEAGQMEVLLWHYAYGKPKEMLQLSGPDGEAFPVLNLVLNSGPSAT